MPAPLARRLSARTRSPARLGAACPAHARRLEQRGHSAAADKPKRKRPPGASGEPRAPIHYCSRKLALPTSIFIVDERVQNSLATRAQWDIFQNWRAPPLTRPANDSEVGAARSRHEMEFI